MKFKKAERKRVKGRVAIEGPTGCGKTWTALGLAQAITAHEGSKVAVIDTERESASIYADKFDFDVIELDVFSVQSYMDAINAAADDGYSVLVIDSLSHAWAGRGGVLEAVDKAAKRMKTVNTYAAWREGTVMQDDLVETILRFPGHVIVTMRSKMEYVQEKNDRGKTQIRKVGLAPVQRDGLEYEFTIVGSMDVDHNMVITKSRCDVLSDQVYSKPDAKFFDPLIAWLDGGADMTANMEETEARKQTALTINKTLAYCKTNKVSNMDVPNRHNAWVNKHLGCDLKDIADLDADKLTAALADLESKVAVHLLAQVLTLDAEIVELSEDADAARKELDGVYETILVKLTGEDSSPTTDPKEASTRSLAKAVPVLTKYRDEIRKEADKSGEAA